MSPSITKIAEMHRCIRNAERKLARAKSPKVKSQSEEAIRFARNAITMFNSVQRREKEKSNGGRTGATQLQNV